VQAFGDDFRLVELAYLLADESARLAAEVGYGA
jgi:hypothetical protein